MSMDLSDRIRLFLRSLSLQGSWNFPRMQGLGFYFSLVPWLRKVSGEGFKEACHRHLDYFNTNPYLSAYVLGAVARLEEEREGETAVEVRNSLMGPLGAVGDGFYWATWLPWVVLLSLAVSLFRVAWAPVILVLLYNTVHLWKRWTYLGMGYSQARSALDGVSRVNGRAWTRVLEPTMTPLLGFILGLSVFGTGTPATALLFFGTAFLLFRRHWRTSGILCLLGGLGVLLGYLGVDMGLPW